MGARKGMSSRRTPVQDRSVATVEALLEATAQILVERGYERASTNAIARRAGVSIGSLYQYFADKDALVQELARRHFTRMEQSVRAALPRLEQGSLEAWIGQVLRSLVSVQRVRPRLTQVFQQQIPRAGERGLLDAFEARMEDMLARDLERVREHLRPTDLRLAARVVVRAVAGVMQTTLRRSEDLHIEPALEDELIALVRGYLLAGAT